MIYNNKKKKSKQTIKKKESEAPHTESELHIDQPKLHTATGSQHFGKDADATPIGRAAEPFARTFAHSDRAGVISIPHAFTCFACVV